MNNQIPTEASAFDEVVASAIAAAGGVDLARAAEGDPRVRTDVVEPLLAALGLWDIRADDDLVQLAAAAVACRAAGEAALPYPVVERLAAPREIDAVTFADPARPRAAMVDLDFTWDALDRAGRRARICRVEEPSNTRLGQFVCSFETDSPRTGPVGTLARFLLLDAWRCLGCLQRAFNMTCEHVGDRHQFGKPLGAFQAVQFMLADMSVALRGLEELAKFTLWKTDRDAETALVDVVALRASALETADAVFRTSHQLHGALGFCDESDLSWLSRFSQPYRRLPFGTSGTNRWMYELMQSQDFVGIFDRESAARWGA